MLAASLSSREKGHGSLRPGQILINDGLRQPNVVVASSYSGGGLDFDYYSLLQHLSTCYSISYSFISFQKQIINKYVIIHSL